MSPYRRGTIVSVAPGVAATAILLATAACDSVQIHTLHTLHTDSAGIPIVTAVAPLWEPDDVWTVDPEPVVEIGTVSGALEYQFSEVVAAVRLSNGDIVVADRRASELRSYGTAGSFQWHVARLSQGPVLPVLRSIHVDATGHLWLQPYFVAGA
ncbi:MAG: hypothetical protein OXN18_02500 [Gemmatimonadota bacterium]|nr:hypothetical protein [Gemmatimonadota bacterium]